MRILPSVATRPERGILTCCLLLCCFGLVMVFSSSAVLSVAEGKSPAFYFESQLSKLLAGLILLACFWSLDYQWLRRKPVAWTALGAGILGLLLLVLGLGVAHGVRAARWLSVQGVTIQPSEFARVGLVIFLAFYLSGKEGILPPGRLFVVPALATFLVAGLVALQPNLSMALFILLLAVGVFYVGGLSIRWLGLATAPPALLALLLMRPYQRERIFGFLGLAGREVAYQVDQSITTVGSGGILGLGLGNGLQKYFFLPFPHTDFILGIVGEETGLLGITLLLLTYGALILFGIATSRRAPDRFGSLLAAGLTWNLAINVLVHGAVNLGMGPVTGVPLPFLSCGGSSLMANLLAVGILLSISRRAVRGAARDWSTVGGHRP
ncbi:MAG: stage V sporulation protein E [Candidatus Eisenbacteria bacterium]|nr:stage V sporulation protein E [Candidatus Eisenbacteria bacterium]